MPYSVKVPPNDKAAIELLVNSAKDIGINRFTFCNLHALLAENLLDHPQDAGRLRTTAVGVAGTMYLFTAIPQLIEEMFELLLAKAAAITDPYEQTLFLMVQLPYLQPFIDVNKRTSRLAANIPLIKLNLVPLSFVDVPERAYTQSVMAVYEFNRVELIRDVSLSEPDLSWLKYRTALREVIGSIIKDSERNLLSERFVSTLDSKYRRLICSDSAKWLCRSAGFARRQLRTLRPAKFRAWLSNRGGNTLTKS